MYDEMFMDSRFILNDVTVPILHKLTLFLRLQQLAAGFVTDGDKNKTHLFADDPTKNPRIKALLETLEDIDGSVIIWCRFQDEIRMIAKLLGDKCVTYYGGDTTSDRKQNMTAFKEGKVKYFVGTAAAGGIGLNLTVSATVIYYSNSFNGGERFQSEDRCHRIGQTNDKVLYIDIEAEDTIDTKIISSLRAKKNLGDYMLELQAQGEKLV
jgi:helicase SWR1